MPSEHTRNVVFVAYHSINEYSEDRIRVPSIVSPANFEAQIRYLSSTARMISLQEYLDHAKEGEPLPEKSVVVTFDDGYKDNLTIAAPILQKYSVPATFFIATDFIGSGGMKWEDQLSCLIRRCQAEVVSVRLSSGKFSYPLRNDIEKHKVIDELAGILGHVSQEERLRVVGELRNQFGLECNHQAGVMMSWEDVRQLANTPGFSIGSHTVTHQHLTRVPLEVAEVEIANSKTCLENEIGMQIKLFSYPYGDYNQDVITTVQRTGYLSAVTIEYGKNRTASNLFTLRRVLVPNQRGSGFRIGMILRSSIVGEVIRKSYNLARDLRNQTPVKKPTLRQKEG